MPRRLPRLALLAALGCSSLPTVGRDASADARDAPCDAATCGGRCVDLARDPAHCGACGSACSDGVGCIRGVCSRRVVQLSAELSTVCARVDDGSVWCWGDNGSGQCGDGSLEATRPRPVRVPGLVATAVAAGWRDACAIVAGGRVRCWGGNGDRAVADDARPVVRAPEDVAVPGPAVALNGSYGICALLDDASVWCRPEFGGQPALPHRRWTDHVVAMEGGWGHVCALLDDGNVGCGGRRGFGQFGDGNTDLAGMDYVAGPVRPVGLPRAVQVASNAEGACARTADGALWCWGKTYLRSTADTTWSPARVDGVGLVREVWSLGHGYIVRRSDGSLRAWGLNPAGGVGDGTTAHAFGLVRPVALDAIAGDIASIAGGVDFACALLRDGTVRCWGSNVAGQLGVGALSSRSLTPVAPRW
jgi:alpha-tubulin suppressor-like RCC1 family protein